MKVTALIPDALIEEVVHYARGKNLTESLVIAMKEWLSAKKLTQLNKKILAKPLQFRRGFSAADVRILNRQR